jgi:acyl-CoA hydrolase
MYPLIFGGALFSQMDLCAANTVKQVLKEYTLGCSAITHKVEVEFSGPSYVGDLIELEGEIISMGAKSIVVNVKAFRSNYEVTRLSIAGAKFIFVTIESIDLHDKPNKLPCIFHDLNLINNSIM